MSVTVDKDSHAQTYIIHQFTATECQDSEMRIRQKSNIPLIELITSWCVITIVFPAWLLIYHGIQTPLVDSLLERLPHRTVPPMIGQQTYKTITNLTCLLNGNATSVQSELGGSQLGHLGLTVSQAANVTLSVDPFVLPPSPGPRNGSANHRNILYIWRKPINMDMPIKEQLIGAIDPMFVQALMHQNTGFASVTTRNRSRHANCVTPARYPQREYVPDRNPSSRTLSCTMTWLQHRTSLVGQINDRRASVVR
jgi:hypothetical protein